MYNICLCGNDKFWWVGKIKKCPKCYREYHVFENYIVMIPALEEQKKIYTLQEWELKMIEIKSKKNNKIRKKMGNAKYNIPI